MHFACKPGVFEFVCLIAEIECNWNRWGLNASIHNGMTFNVQAVQRQMLSIQQISRIHTHTLLANLFKRYSSIFQRFNRIFLRYRSIDAFTGQSR